MKKFYSLSCLFVLLILWSGASAGSLNSLPVHKTFSGINEVPVTNLQATLTNEFSGEVNLTWECNPSAGFLYYTVKRDGIQLAIIPSALTYSDILPAFGNYTYCVEAVYGTGPSGPACTVAEWPNPTMVWTPTQLMATVLSGMNSHNSMSIGNTGDGPLAFEFPDYTDHLGDSPLAYCPASATDEDEFISLVQLGTINNSSGWNGYSDYTSITTDVVKELSYPITVIVGPPSYSGDITGVWIDFDHSNTFDAAELFALTGTSPATGAITIPSAALTGPTTMRVRTQYNGTLSPCGNTQYGEVEDYTINIKQPTFITSVTPASGMVAQHTTPGVVVDVIFSATGQFATAGVYTNQLELNSNDPGHASVNITAIMTVGIPGYLQGTVTDCITGEPINGVLVTAGSFNALTNDTGFYSMILSPGYYTVNFTKIGFQPVTATASVTANIVTTVNAQMCETPYPPACAHASVNFEDTECTVSWCPPAGPHEILYDDGTAENYAAWEFAGNRNAVKFTPQGYPASITGARFFINSGGFGNPIGSTFGVLVCKADAAGLPGQVIDSLAVSVFTTGWLTVTGMSATITSGDFFIVMIQGQPAPNCPYLGVDETPPTVNKSYSRDVVNGGAWELSAYQDFMIRAIVSSPDTGGVTFYSVSRVFLGASNPVPPASGVHTLVSNTLTDTIYSESGVTWANLSQGWYAYGITAQHGIQQSEIVYTNMVPHKIFADLTINAQLECGLVPAEGAIVTLTGNNYPYDILTDTVSASGTLTFSQIIQGEFSISITYPEYENYTQQVSLSGNEVVDAVLLQIHNKPLNLNVSENELVATWQAPRGILMNEDFEGGTFPSSGWWVSTWEIGWYSTTDGSSASLAIPPHTTYAVVNDELWGPTSNGCCDYLYTPLLDLRGSPDYTLTFSSFFNGLNGQLGYVEISTDYGATWAPLFTCQSTYGYWGTKTIDLSAYSGPSGSAGVMFAFHADDAGNQASGWAIDDVSVTYGGLDVSGYKVYLNGTEMGQTTSNTWTFDPATFDCQDYQAAVEAIYCTGASDPATYDFTNAYAYPPANLAADTSITATSGAVILSWQMPLNCLSNVVSYNIYRNDTAWIAQVPVTDTLYLDMDLLPGTYCYKMTSVIDLTPWGFPGMFGESEFSLPACADLIYGGDLPFSDDFSDGAFDTTMWNPGQNWLVDEDSDNPVPAAKFKWDPLMTNYSSALQSNALNISEIDTTNPFKIYFDYEIKLEDFSASGSEKLTVEIWNGSGWNAAKEYTNTGSFDWTMEHLDITTLAGDQAFMVRFRANGSSSDAIRYWAVDNVHIYYSETYLLPPMNLVVNPSGSIGSENHLIWEPPLTGNTIMSYILDDNTVEFSTFYNATGECWLGNEFPVTESGVLQSVSLYMEANNGSAIYSIAIFDENRDSLYNSEPFIPVFGEWTDVELPFVEFNGSFYVMLHMVVTNNSDYLALDQDGPNTAASLAWYTDDLLAWAQLSDLGFEPSVAFIRATGITSDKKTSVTFNPRSAGTGSGTVLPSALASIPLSANTGRDVAHSTPLSDNSETLLGYNIYRRGYAVFPPGQNTATSGYWTLITPTLVLLNEYFDQYLSNLEYNCYDYRVSAEYEAGAAVSNLEWGCIFTNINPVMTREVNLYPNPATTFIRVELNGNISDLKVYNSLGLMVTEKNIAGETTVILNTSDYAAGMYTAKFTTRHGESFSRKFVVLR